MSRPELQAPPEIVRVLSLHFFGREDKQHNDEIVLWRYRGCKIHEQVHINPHFIILRPF
jgi:hypothetical protein